jgi:lipoprotein-anchoring transpeptidase ErfK/SrfK
MSSVTFLAPVDYLPAEGMDFTYQARNEADACAALFAGSEIRFEVNPQGVMLLSNPQEAEVFQQVKIQLDGSGEAKMHWQDEAISIRLADLFRNRESFATLSDASEPEDCVRRFLEVFASSLDDPLLGTMDRRIPLIRWQAGDDGNSAQVQLLGLLLADEEQFREFCEGQGDGIALLFEDSEVEAHGIREAIVALTLLGISLSAVTPAQAGLSKAYGGKKAGNITQVAQQRNIQKTTAPVPSVSVSATGYVDTHNDAYINYELLQSNQSGEKRIIVDVANQRAYLIIDNVIALHTAVSTAREGKETPRGVFKITERVESGKTSTIYGCNLPYWQRLGDSAVGLHVGDLPGYPASAGCIRLPHSVAPVIFQNTKSGITVEVVDSWSPSQLQQGPLLVAQVVNQNPGS